MVFLLPKRLRNGVSFARYITRKNSILTDFDFKKVTPWRAYTEAEMRWMNIPTQSQAGT
jgi:hypothetical protein